eukprot:gb/GECH01005052.1/.p1 GENE.gb/GECH01005052.1/~~gb/GECH01005052.1/.p1  ORF type:complete len:388 (+),score=62.18 gb/GECH01005052.1/:1-1164(+)
MRRINNSLFTTSSFSNIKQINKNHGNLNHISSIGGMFLNLGKSNQLNSQNLATKSFGISNYSSMAERSFQNLQFGDISSGKEVKQNVNPNTLKKSRKKKKKRKKNTEQTQIYQSKDSLYGRLEERGTQISSSGMVYSDRISFNMLKSLTLLGIEPKYNEEKVFAAAFTHRSFSTGKLPNNDQLRALGRMILQRIVLERVMSIPVDNPKLHQEMLAVLTTEHTLAFLGMNYGISSAVRMDTTAVKRPMNVVGDVYTALLAVIHKLRGFESAQEFVEQTLFRLNFKLLFAKFYAADPVWNDKWEIARHIVGAELYTKPNYRVKPMGLYVECAIIREVNQGKQGTLLESASDTTKEEALHKASLKIIDYYYTAMRTIAQHFQPKENIDTQ